MSERYGRLEGPRWEFDEWDERYPARLRDTPAHPDRLYVLGNPDALRAQSVRGRRGGLGRGHGL